MKTIIIKTICFFIFSTVLSVMSSCNYLDIVPDERPTEDDAFANANAAERYLYSCYSYLPNSRAGSKSLDFFTSDEVVTAFEHETFAHFPKGNYTSVNPVISYWNTLWGGIRQCWILISKVDDVPNLTSENKVLYKAEAKFLIAYYHYLLLRCYGPIMIVDQILDVNMPFSAFPERLPYDECVSWISNMFDEAGKDLPDVHVGTSFGRATKIAALGIKSRMLLFAASPLFNGNAEYYSNLQSKVDGRALMPLAYDATKWNKAAEATKLAIERAEANGYTLYYAGAPDQQKPQPKNPSERNLRYTFVDIYNQEVIWGDTRQEGNYDLQNKSTPFQGGYSWNGVGPTLRMIESFYTKNGLPIDQDPEWNYSKRYETSEQQDNKGITLNLNLDREPRFNAWIAFHNSWFEIAKYNKVDVKEGYIQVQFRKNDNCGIQGRSNNYTPTGYLNKKGVSPAYASVAISVPPKYAWPLLRLGELYLNYAEVLVEIGELDMAKKYLNLIRERAGIPSVDESWSRTRKPLTQERLREIVRQERTIELYLENHRFWDVRRWKLGDKYFNVKAKGMNIQGVDDASFFNVTEVVFQRKFLTPTHYLLPIPLDETNKNTKLVQNPGY